MCLVVCLCALNILFACVCLRWFVCVCVRFVCPSICLFVWLCFVWLLGCVCMLVCFCWLVGCLFVSVGVGVCLFVRLFVYVGVSVPV